MSSRYEVASRGYSQYSSQCIDLEVREWERDWVYKSRAVVRFCIVQCTDEMAVSTKLVQRVECVVESHPFHQRLAERLAENVTQSIPMPSNQLDWLYGLCLCPWLFTPINQQGFKNMTIIIVRLLCFDSLLLGLLDWFKSQHHLHCSN